MHELAKNPRSKQATKQPRNKHQPSNKAALTNQPEALDGKGATALFRAAGTGAVESARVLVASGRFDLNATNGRGQSLVEVAQSSSGDMVRFLRRMGAGQQSTWSGVSGRAADDDTRAYGQGASWKRQERARAWREGLGMWC